MVPPTIDLEEEHIKKPRRRVPATGGKASVSAAQEPSRSPFDDREDVIGDDLGLGRARSVDLGAPTGEGQLSSQQIEAAFDLSMGRIRRCLVLVASDEAPRGRMVFGLRITAAGRVESVNLKGPTSVVSGDSGDCLREAARAIAFPRFDGDDMIVHYPITLQ